MKIGVHFWSHVAQFFLEWGIFWNKSCREKLHYIIIIFKKYIYLKYVPLMGRIGKICTASRPHMIVWRLLFVCWTNKATSKHMEYVICGAFPLQQRLHKRTSVLRYTCTACVVVHNVCTCANVFMHKYVICVRYFWTFTWLLTCLFSTLATELKRLFQIRGIAQSV
jgi:hypothetical protein